jgi:glycosyltransferase involved in cell wall biosynthesis
LLDFANVKPERVHIVPHGPYDSGRPTAERQDLRRRFGWPQDKQVALFFGNIRDDKNLDVMLRALQPHCRDVHLVVAGRAAGGPHQPVAVYRALASQLGIERSVTFDTRYIDDADIPNLFEACDWAALPYSRAFTSQSGVLNVAASYRRPVLLSDTPTFAETLAQARIGVLAAPDDVPALARGIGEMLAAVHDGHAFEFDAYLRLFGWDTNVRLTRAVYRSLCD